MAPNPSDSLMAKIKNAAKALNISMPMAMRRYAYERMLMIMSDKNLGNDFVIKGGMLMGAMFNGKILRPTEDLDLNGLKDGMSIRDMEGILKLICEMHDGSDGLTFDFETLKVIKNRDDDIVRGGKIHMTAFIGRARIPMKIDIGYGNPITPDMEMIKLPTLIPGLIPSIPFQAYPVETIISEKLHAAYRHGQLNTRQKDYFDIFSLVKTYDIYSETLSDAMVNTFAKFDNTVPALFPALSPEFARQKSQEGQWRAFLSETNVDNGISFVETVAHCAEFAYPIIEAIHGADQPGLWTPQQGWHQPSLSLAM